MSNAPLPSLPPSWEAELGREDRIELACMAWGTRQFTAELERGYKDRMARKDRKDR